MHRIEPEVLGDRDCRILEHVIGVVEDGHEDPDVRPQLVVRLRPQRGEVAASLGFVPLASRHDTVYMANSPRRLNAKLWHLKKYLTNGACR